VIQRRAADCSLSRLDPCVVLKAFTPSSVVREAPQLSATCVSRLAPRLQGKESGPKISHSRH
jgi:hypothetical protein